MRLLRAHRRRRDGQRGQSLVEGMLVLGLIVVVGVSAVSLAVRVVAQIQFEAAVANAAASTLAAQRGQRETARADAIHAFDATLANHPNIHVTPTNGVEVDCQPSPAGDSYTCSARGSVSLPIGPAVGLSATASVAVPVYRQ